MKQGETFEFKIDDFGMNGEGLAHAEGFTVFIPFAIPGEKVNAAVEYAKRGSAYAELKEILEHSPLRIKPPCNRTGRCGGCDLMHVEYSAQLALKKKNLQTVLRKNAGCEFPVSDVVPSPEIYGYRNKMALPFGTVGGKTALGFFREGSHKIVSITKCFLQGEWAEKLINITLNWANASGLTVYDEESGKGLLRHLVARYIGGLLNLTLVVNGNSVPKIESYTEALRAAFPRVSLYLSPNTERTNVIMGKRVVPLSVTDDDYVTVSGIKIRVNPFSFFQVNDGVRALIYEKVLSEIPFGSTVIDAYAGVGLLGAILIKNRNARVYNIEIVREAVLDADRLTAENGLSGRTVNICGDAAEELPKLLRATALTSSGALTVVLDPPRKGVAPEVIAALSVSESLTKLIYISCNPATLSRDLALLTPSFDINSITPFDMFPHTRHLETLVCLTRKP